MRRKAQHRQIVATELLALVAFERPAKRFLLGAHRNAAILLEQLQKSPLAERAAAGTADLVDQTVGAEVEGITVVIGEGVIGVGGPLRVAPIADSLAIAFDLDDVFLVRAPQREARPGEAHLPLGGLDEADAGLEPVIRLAPLLVLAEQAPHAAMESG